MQPIKIALIYNAAVEYTTGNYFRDLLNRRGAQFRIFSPREQERIPADFRLRFYIDDASHYAIRPAPDALKVLYLIDTHTSFIEDEVMSRTADLVFCAQKEAADAIATRHPATHWLPLGCDPAVHYRQVEEKPYDVSFIGGVVDERRARILSLLKERYPRSFIGRAPRERIGEIYSSSKIVVNCAVDHDLNMRFFEGLCSGALLLTDRIDNSGLELLLRQAPAPFCALYRDSAELVAQIDYYLAHDAEREELARRGSLFAASQRYEDRWDAILDRIQGLAPRNLGWGGYLECRLRLTALELARALARRLGRPYPGQYPLPERDRP